MANRVLLGDRSVGGYGLYVSKSGNNVIDTDNANLLFNSSIIDSGAGIESKNGQTFALIQQGIVTGSSSIFIPFPAIKDSTGNYSSPFCLAAWKYAGSGDNSEPHIGVNYDSSNSSSPIWGGMLEIYGYGFNSSGGTYSSGTMYGRIFTLCPSDATFYYAVFHMAMER